MKRLSVLLLLILFSSSIFANTGFDEPTPEIDGEGVCMIEAIKKLAIFASKNEGSLVPNSLRLVDNDRRTLNPIHYSWWELDVELDGEVRTIRTDVQYNRFTKKCL